MAKQRFERLVLGYSFGISKTGRPGILNERIARFLGVVEDLRSDSCFVGLQWEIQDALTESGLEVTADCVVGPQMV